MKYNLVLYLTLAAIVTVSFCNLYDPHVFPASGPFFEGWYLRFMDQQQNRSFAVLFGSVLPAEESKVKDYDHLAYLGLLYEGYGKSLSSFNTFPAIDQVNITVKNDLPVTKNPDKESPASFCWKTPSNGYIKIDDNSAKFNVNINSVEFSGVVGKPVPWGPDGNGPAGHLDDLPLPLHWFVYSLRSPIVNYRWKNKTSGEVIKGNTGMVHMEKNWGRSFPRAWIWTQGVTLKRDHSFALSYGPVTFASHLNVPGHLFGYRNNENNLSLDFTPINSYMHHKEDGCNGNISITLYGLAYCIEITVVANMDSFSSCLYGPMQTGFHKVAVESYNALATIKVYRRNWFDWEFLEMAQFQQSALEFGGNYMCKPC